MSKYDIAQLVEELYVLGVLPKQVIPPPTPPEFPSGTRMLFQQTAAPVGWTKATTHNDKALRIVSGSVGSGGDWPFSGIFNTYTPAGTISSVAAGGTVASHTLTVAQIPSHAHKMSDFWMDGGNTGPNAQARAKLNVSGQVMEESSTGNQGGGGGHTHGFTGTAHTHTFTGTARSFNVQYVDVIIAQKD